MLIMKYRMSLGGPFKLSISRQFLNSELEIQHPEFKNHPNVIKPLQANLFAERWPEYGLFCVHLRKLKNIDESIYCRPAITSG
jgi:hypothetical protein